MNEFEKKRRKLELARVRLSREELEFKIEERMQEIDRLKEAIDKQLEKEKEIEKELN
jgi:hypothetical protein